MLDLNILKETKGRFSLLNSPEAKVVDRINESLMWGAMTYCKKKGFVWIDVPTMTKITGACENVNTLYELEHFGQEAYLAQTGQLYLEAKIPGHEKVWTIIDSFRAEKESDSRHLNQFKLIELEHRGNLEMIIGHIEGIIKSMIRETVDQNKEILKELKRYEELQEWVAEDFYRTTYTNAIEKLKIIDKEIEWGDDLKQEHELYLVKEIGNKPLFITYYPKAIKFFNMKENNWNPAVVDSTDLIMPYSGESVGAAEREDDYKKLVTRLKESQMFKILTERGKTLEDFKDYLDLVEKNPILHSGCGIGLSRVTQSILGVEDIRIANSYPLQSNILY